jgi:hypothetical protein
MAVSSSGLGMGVSGSAWLGARAWCFSESMLKLARLRFRG